MHTTDAHEGTGLIPSHLLQAEQTHHVHRISPCFTLLLSETSWGAQGSFRMEPTWYGVYITCVALHPHRFIPHTALGLIVCTTLTLKVHVQNNRNFSYASECVCASDQPLRVYLQYTP